MELSEEKKLIEKAKHNPAFFGAIFDIYYPKIFGYALRRTANVEVARDIASEVFFKALKALPSFTWRGISISSWLYRIASNEVHNYFRHKKYQPRSLDELYEVMGFESKDTGDLLQEITAAEQALERHQEFLTLQRLLRKISLKYQETLSLHYFEEKSIKEIAEILRKREGTVKSLLSRGREQLRNLYEEEKT